MKITRAYTLQKALEKAASGARPMAGCTNILVDIKKQGDCDQEFVDITAIPALKHWDITAEHASFGALFTFDQAEKLLSPHPAYAALYQAAYQMGGPQIRNRATIAGNICDASPACDSGPALLVLEAQLTLASVRGVRQLPVEDFFLDVRRTARAWDEVLTDITIAGLPGRSFFHKAGQRRAMAVSMVSLAGKQHEDGRVLLAMGSVAPCPVRLYYCEQCILGKNAVSKEELRRALEMDIAPIAGRSVSAEYRMDTANRMVISALEKEFGYAVI